MTMGLRVINGVNRSKSHCWCLCSNHVKKKAPEARLDTRNAREIIQLISFLCFFHPVLELLNNEVLNNSVMLGFSSSPLPIMLNLKGIKLDRGTTTAAKGCT